MCRRERVIGAAWARFVVNSAAADAGPSAARMARSSAEATALMPQCTPAVLKPAGAVMPPLAGLTRTSAKTPGVTVFSAMQRRQRHERLVRAAQLALHRVLAAAPEVRTGVAIGHDLLRQPDVRHHRKAKLHEIGRRVREGAQLLEAGNRRPRHELVDQLAAEPEAARLLAGHQRADFADVAAERRQLGAGDDAIVL